MESSWHWGCFKTIWVKIGAQTKKFLASQCFYLVCLFVRLSVTQSVCHTICLSHSLSVTPSVCHTLDTSHSRRARKTPPKAAILRVYIISCSAYKNRFVIHTLYLIIIKKHKFYCILASVTQKINKEHSVDIN